MTSVQLEQLACRQVGDKPTVGSEEIVAGKIAQIAPAQVVEDVVSHLAFEVVDGEELNRMVEQKLGAEWERVIRETSRKGNSQTLVYMHPEGGRMGLFVLDLDGQEMDVVQVSVDPKHLNESLGKYEHHHGNDVDSEKSHHDGDVSD